MLKRVLEEQNSPPSKILYKNGNNFQASLYFSFQIPLVSPWPNNKVKKCQFCSKLFSDTWNLKRHLRCHTGEKPYACSLCPYKATQSGNVKLHMRNAHKMP